VFADAIYEAGYFALSKSHLTLAFLFLLFVISLNFTVFFSELTYARLLGHTKNNDMLTFQVTLVYLSNFMSKITQYLNYK